MIESLLKRIMGVLLLVLMSFYAQAQIGPGPTGPPPPNPVPITGIELLIGAGALLGIKKMFGSKKKN